jgi:N-acetylglucosaminyl-diphospho-decaprenol L-rhamnosyltransferase
MHKVLGRKTANNPALSPQFRGEEFPLSRPVKLAVVIVNYETAHLVMQCLTSLLREVAAIDARVIIVDNCSSDDSVRIICEWILAHDDRRIVQLIESKANGGFSFGNNIGMRAVDADYYLLLNSDTIVRPQAIDRLLETADSHPEAGLISPRLEWADEVPQQSCFRYPSPISEFIDVARTSLITTMFKRFDVPLPVSDIVVHPDWTSFACVLVRHRVVDKIGLMDDGFFMYFEDIEFCRRARNAGWVIIHDPEARVVHLRGGSSPVKQRVIERKRLPRYYYASRTRYFYLAYGRVGLTLANLSWLLGRCVSKCREALERRGPSVPEKQWLDIWTNWLDPGVRWSQQHIKSPLQ